MAVTIVVEDGSIVANANSFQTVADVRAYAEQRGINMTGDSDDQIGAWLINATDYLNSFECQYQGSRVDCATQLLAWPRSDVEFCCEAWPEDQIPGNLKAAQNALVIAQKAGIVLFPNIGAADYVIREKVGPIETEYANPIESGVTTRITGVEALLAPLFGSCGESSGFPLRTMRV